MGYPVIIAVYDPQWSVLYQKEKERILAVIGHQIAAIEHIGSTAVPGLGAKSIIDIMVAVNQLADAEKYIEPLESIGYRYVPENEAEFPERRYFDKGPPGARLAHLHMVELTSDFWERLLLFWDYLRNHPDVSQQYYQLKRQLADMYGSDRAAYTEAKTSFIEAMVERARADKTTDS